MQSKIDTDKQAVLTLSLDELCLINNALKESLEALGRVEDEFQSRMGDSTDAVKSLLSEINSVVRELL